jgi:hypothetical protein
MPQARDDSARIQVGKRRELHRRERGVASHGRNDAEPHCDALGRCQGRGGGDTAGEEAILGKPQLVDTGLFDQAATCPIRDGEAGV